MLAAVFTVIGLVVLSRYWRTPPRMNAPGLDSRFTV